MAMWVRFSAAALLGAPGGGDEARGHEVYQLALGDLDVAGLPVFRLGRVHGHPADGRILAFVAHELVLDLQGLLPEAELLINPDAERLVGGDHVGEEEDRHPHDLLVHGPQRVGAGPRLDVVSLDENYWHVPAVGWLHGETG